MKKFLTIVLVFAAIQAFCQGGGVGINSDGNPPAPSAILDIKSSNKGMLMPRLTRGQRDSIANPDFGLMIFNTTTNCINIWLGSTWKQSCFDCDFSAPVAGNNGPICAGGTLLLTATNIAGATYQWAGPNGFTDTAQNPSIVNASAGASGSYSVRATLNGCTSQPQSTVATVNAIPQPPVAANHGPLCYGQTLNLTATTIAGATYSWSGPNNFTSNQQNPSITNATGIDSGTYSVVATVNSCSVSPQSTVVIINPVPQHPTASASPNPICDGGSFTLSASTISGAGYNWTGPNGYSSASQNPVINNSSAADTGVYFVTATVNGCTSSADSVKVKIAKVYRAFRLTITGSTSPSQASVAEIQFYANGAWVVNDMTSDNSPSPKVVTGSQGDTYFYSTAPPWKAFDGVGPSAAYTNGVLNSGGNNFPYSLEIDYGQCNGFIPTQYSLATSGYSDSGGTYRPTAWTLEASFDGLNWITLDSESGVSFAGGETKTYSIP